LVERRLSMAPVTFTRAVCVVLRVDFSDVAYSKFRSRSRHDLHHTNSTHRAAAVVIKL
jgi:hypothetical protein